MNVECYAQRLLNPFRGTVHTIRYASAEAVTTDGVHWDIYVSNDELVRDLEVGRRVQVSDIRYGSWSAEKGLKRGPLYPSDDFRRMEAQGAIVYEHLLRVHEQVPFAFRDRYELWLLDAGERPLALLQSALSERDLELDAASAWQAGLAARDRFASLAMQSIGRENAADYLTRYINAWAGEHPATQWFRRETDGAGTGLAGGNLVAGLIGRRLDPEDFPELLLAAIGHDEPHRQLIQDFHAWQAVWLLLLPGLGSPVRRALERQARQQARFVEGHYRLYPEILDEAAINAARIEDMIRRSQGRNDAGDENSLSTFYIELNPAGGNYN